MMLNSNVTPPTSLRFYDIIKKFIPKGFENKSIEEISKLSIDFRDLGNPETFRLILPEIMRFNLSSLELSLCATRLNTQYQFVTELLIHFHNIKTLSLTYPDAEDITTEAEQENIEPKPVTLNHLFDAAAHLTQLQSFKISSTGNYEDEELLEDTGGFIDLLPNKRHLKSLCINLPNFAGECWTLLKALENCPSLEHFDYRTNIFNEYENFCERILNDKTIRTVKLDLNTAVTEVDFINFFLCNESLNQLDIKIYNNSEVIEPDEEGKELSQWAQNIYRNATLKHLRLHIEIELPKFDVNTFGVTNLLESIAKNQTLLSVDVNFGIELVAYFGETWPEVSQGLVLAFEKNYSLLQCKIEPELDVLIRPFLERNKYVAKMVLSSFPTLNEHYFVDPSRYNANERNILTGNHDAIVLTENSTFLISYFVPYQALSYILSNLIANKELLLNLIVDKAQYNSLALAYGAVLSRYLTYIVSQLLNLSDSNLQTLANTNISRNIGEFLEYRDLRKISALTGGFFLRAKKEADLLPPPLSLNSISP